MKKDTHLLSNTEGLYQSRDAAVSRFFDKVEEAQKSAGVSPSFYNLEVQYLKETPMLNRDGSPMMIRYRDGEGEIRERPNVSRQQVNIVVPWEAIEQGEAAVNQFLEDEGIDEDTTILVGAARDELFWS